MEFRTVLSKLNSKDELPSIEEIKNEDEDDIDLYNSKYNEEEDIEQL